MNARFKKKSFAAVMTSLGPALFCAWHGVAVLAAANTTSFVVGHEPAQRARIVIVDDPEATKEFKPSDVRVEAMLNNGIRTLCGKATPSAGWLDLVSTQDVAGIKVYSAPGPISGTRPAVVRAIVKGLLDAGLPAGSIVIWDKRLEHLRQAGFIDLAQELGVRAAGCVQEGYDKDVFYETPLIGQLIWGDSEFGQKDDTAGRKSFISKLVTKQITTIISVTPLLNHNHAGVTGNLYSLAIGSVDNTMRFETDKGRLATAVPEIYALPVLSDRVVLSIVDALICQYEGEHRSLLHYSTTVNQLWLSTDPVALDSFALLEMTRHRAKAGVSSKRTYLELLENAALLQLGISNPTQIQVEFVR